VDQSKLIVGQAKTPCSPGFSILEKAFVEYALQLHIACAGYITHPRGFRLIRGYFCQQANQFLSSQVNKGSNRKKRSAEKHLKQKFSGTSEPLVKIHAIIYI